MKRKLLIKTAMALALLLGAVGVQADLPQGQVKSSLQGQTSKRQSGEQVARHSSRFVQSSADQKEEKKRPARVLELRADAAESPTLIGYAYAGSTAGMYSIPFDGSTSCTLLKESGLSAVKNAVLAGNTYYTTTSTGMAYNPTIMHQEWSIDTWTSTEYSGAKGQLPLASCYNSADGKIYGFWMNNSYDYEFKTIKYGASTEVTDIVTVKSAQFGGSDVCAMAAAANGTMYVFCKNGKLYSIDASGSYTLIGNTTKSTTVTGSAGAAIHPTTGKLYYAVYTGGSSKLFDVDMTTATATEVATFDTKYQFVGLGFTGGGGTTPQPTLAEPAAVTDLAVNFPAGSMNGTVTFKMPTTDLNGIPASGPCNYTITLGGNTFDGTSEYGASVTKDVYVDDFGEYNCTVYAVNGVGQGVPAYADVVVTAPVLPGAVTDLAANFPDGSLEGTISFKMPTVMADGSPAPTGEPVMFQISFSDQAASPAGDMSTYGAPVSVPVTVSAFGTYTVTVTAMNQGGQGAAAELVFTVRDKVEISAPSVATNLKAEYTDGNLAGKLSFDMPATYDNGNTPAAGTVVNYLAKVYDSANAVVKSFMGSKEFGGHVENDYTLPAYGTYKFEVVIQDLDHELQSQKTSIDFTVNETTGPAVPTSAPAKPTDFNVVFDNGLQGKATFTVPTTLRDGTTWTAGKVTYDVYISEGHWTGEAAYGEAVTVAVSVPETNDYMCFLMLTNEAGESDQAMLMNIHAEGPTTPPTPTDPVAPGAVTNLTTSFTDGSLTGTISFDMPTTLADGTTPAADVPVYYNIQINGMDPIIFPSTYGAHVDQSVTLPAYGTYTASVTAVDMENEVYSATVTSEEFTVNEGTVTPPTPASSYKLVGYSMNKQSDSGWDRALYTIPTDGSSELTLVKALDAGADVKYAFMAGNTYYTTIAVKDKYSMSEYHHVPFSTVTWDKLAEAVVGDKSQLPKGVTYCNGKIYGIFSYNYTKSFCSLDIADGAGTLTPIVEGGEFANFTASAMATGLDGTIYIFCKNGKLMTVNPADGALTEIGDMGVTSKDPCGAAVDPATGTIYYAAYNGTTTSLYTVDPATAAATQVSTFTGKPQLVGLGFLPEPAAAAPTKPADFAVVFDNGLEGKATFTVPTTLADGSTRTEGSVEYQVMIAEGSWKGMASYGEAVTVPVSVTETNDYSCFVMLTNEAGVSDQAMLTGVHAEKPVVAPGAVTNLTTDFAEGSLEGTISFDMPATLADGTEPAADAQVFYNIQINGMDPIVAPAAYGAHVEQKVLLPDYGTYTAAVTAVDMENEVYSATVTSEEFTVTEPAVTPTEPAKLVGYFVSPTGSAPGVYSIPTDGTTASTLIKALVPDVSNGVLAGDKYYVTTLAGNYYDGWNITFKGYNALTWDIITDVKDESESPNQHVPYAATYCPTDGKIYAITIDGDFYNVFGTLDYATGTMTPIKRHNSSNQSQDFYAMAAGTDGTIYAFRGNGTMYTFDKATGEMTEVGSTGLSFGGKGSAVVDPATGVMYLTNNNELYTIDKTNCTATKIATFENSGRILGLAMLSSEAPDPVPSPVENLAVNFEGESLTGTVTFTTPATLVDGTAGEGTLTYEVKANGSLLASAVTGFGQDVTANVTLTESGEYEFAVTVYNEAGTSEAVKLTQRVGNIPMSGIIPPYLNTFDNTSSAEGFTMLNLNGDGLEWQFDANGRYWMGYNMQQDMNAWIISPAVNLEAGKLYDISIVASAGNSAYPERAAIWLGTEANPDMMVIPVVEPTKITSPTGQTLKGMIMVNTTGQYYVGIHGCSDKDMFRLFIDDLSISAPKPTTLPGAVTDFTVSNPAMDLNATISLKAPSVDFAGNALTTIDKIELSRGGELIKTFETPAPGAVLTYTDVVPTNGNYTYSAVASNADGVGPMVSVKQYIGTPAPSAPTNAVIKETSNEGEVTITWDAPAVDKDGRPIDPSIISYDILNTQDPGAGAVVSDLKETSYTFRAVQAGSRDIVQYAIFAKTIGGPADVPATTELYPVGKAYPMPVSESFPDGDVANEYIWGNAAYPGYNTWWEICTVDNGLVPQDNDNGYLSSFGPAVGDKAVLYFSKIAVAADAVNPILSYWYYKASDGNNTIEARVDAGNGVESLQTVVCGPEAEGWKRAIVPLDNYKGKDIRLSLVTTVGDYYQATPIDNISVFEYLDKNLTLAAMDVHSSVNAGEDLALTVKVSNTGRLAVDAYTVELFRDGQSYETKECTAIEPDAVNSVQFSVPVDMATASKISFKAVVNYAEDMDTEDNSSETIDVAVIIPPYPVPTDLTGVYSGENVTLSWTAPEGTEAGLPLAETDSFEEYESFSVDKAGDWTFYDVDGSATWGWGDVSLPNDGEPMAYVVYDYSQAPSQWVLSDPHTGDKAMVCMASKVAPNDDWMISPELYGCAQNVSFYARAVQPAYQETFEVHYSTTGKEISDFSLLKKETMIPGEWTKYQYNLPEGAKYFAIRCVSHDCLGLMIDDAEFIPADADVQSLEVLGYNVYRDGVKINTELVAETTYNDVTTVTTETEYFVTAVYEPGESAASNKVKPTSGIGSAYNGDITITAGCGTITVTGAVDTNVAVYTTAGYALYNEQGAETTIIRTEPGVYIVKAGTRTAKVVVK